DRGINGLAIPKFGKLRFGISAPDVLDGVLELNAKVKVLIRLYGKILPAVLRVLRGLPSQHHFRVFYKIAVDGKAVVVLSKMYPIGFNLHRSVSLLQEDDVGYDFGSRIGLERIVRQTNSAQKLRPLCNIFADFW